MAPSEPALEAIRLLVLDVDGVLTDGSILLDGDGRETKRFHVHDGSAIRYWKRAGKACAILTGRRSEAVERRAVELGIDRVVQGALDKLPAYEALARDLAVRDEEVCFIGDDLTDLPVLRRVGFPVAVANARPEVLRAAAYATACPGGRGAVRETVERILKAQGLWQGILEGYGG